METKKILAFFSEDRIKRVSFLITGILFLIGFLLGFIYSRESYGNFSYEPYKTINTYLIIFFIIVIVLFFINSKVRLETLSGTLLWNYIISPAGFLIGGAISRWIMPLSTIDQIPYLTKLSYHFDTVKVFTPLFLILPTILFIGLFIQHYRIKDSDV